MRVSGIWRAHARILFAAAVLAGGVGAATVVRAQEPEVASQDPPATQVDDILVEGRLRSPEEVDRAARDFVNNVTDPPRGRGVARWRRAVCVGVANLDRQLAQAIVDRVSSVASDVGLETGEPGCEANILIVATDDGAAMATAMVEARYGAFRNPHIAGTSHSNRRLERFRSSDSPVKWWHVTLPLIADTGVIAVRVPGASADSAAVARTVSSLLRTPIRYDMLRAFIVVDLSQIEGMSVDQLSDYIAMVALAQIDPDADTSGHDTILNLFLADADPPGMTSWDRSYLHALYSVELNQAAPNAQTGTIGSEMSRDQRGLNQD